MASKTKPKVISFNPSFENRLRDQESKGCFSSSEARNARQKANEQAPPEICLPYHDNKPQFQKKDVLQLGKWTQILNLKNLYST